MISLAAIHGRRKLRDRLLRGAHAPSRAICHASAAKLGNTYKPLDIPINQMRLARAPIVARVGACVPQSLQAHLLGVLRLNPAAQVIRQRGVHPIAARA